MNTDSKNTADSISDPFHIENLYSSRKTKLYTHHSMLSAN